MRQAGTVEIFEEGGVVHCLVMTGAGCGQHERGIEPLLRYAGIPIGERREGIADRTSAGPIQKVAFEHLEGLTVPTTRKRTGAAVLALGQDAAHGWAEPTELAKRYLSFTAPLHGAWDDRDVCLVARDDVSMAALADFDAAARRGDFAMWYGNLSRNPFDRPGLVLAIPSKVPERLKREMLDNDVARNRLADAAAATGIKARIDEARATSRKGFADPIGYHALSPGWLAERRMDREVSTTHDVVFFLNPVDQAANNHGWFTVEELDEWISGSGPVRKAGREGTGSR